jgi:hypothetical protein
MCGYPMVDFQIYGLQQFAFTSVALAASAAVLPE